MQGHMAPKQRFHIERGLQEGKSLREIAKSLKCHPSTVSREIKRNSGKQGYEHEQADKLAKERRQKASSVPRKMTEDLWTMVTDLLVQNKWSPQQIAGRLHLEGVVSVSHTWIYKYIWEDKDKGGSLFSSLRRRGKKKNRRGKNDAGRGLIPGRVDISKRPPEVDNRTRIGDWEGDTIIGSRHRGALASVVERQSKFTLLRKVAKKRAKCVTEALLDCLLPVAGLVHTITTDNGKEFAGHAKVAEDLSAGFYFATPYRSWERGLNEHTNGLVRQFFGKKQDLTKVTHEQVRKVQDLLNNRPRKALGYRTPAEVFEEALRRAGNSKVTGDGNTIKKLCCYRR